MKHIAKFGIELEGGWDTEPPAHRADARSYHDDGSVYVTGNWRAGEIVSKPLKSWKLGRDFINDNYPDHVGGSCGLHLHMSFKNNIHAISLLCDSKEYQDGLLKALSDWGKKRKNNVTNSFFWSRMNGENSYCKLDWDGHGVIGHERYRVVNFTAFMRHGTVEIRVLPMFRAKRLAQGAIKRILSYTEWYLSKMLKTQPEIEYEVIVPMPSAEELAPVSINSQV